VTDPVFLYQDQRLLVANKPAGLLTVGADAPSLEHALAEHGLRARPVHRLDRDVSGCVVCALDGETRARLEELFREQRVRKSYWALVQGAPSVERGKWHAPILEERGFARVSARGKPALTHYRVVRRLGAVTELEIELVTGRMNQIRVHAAHAGHALVGETKYAERKRDPLRAPRLALHARTVAFPHPWTREPLEVEAPLPGELLALCEAAEEA
jgi:RluA family pseudouridine synthase